MLDPNELESRLPVGRMGVEVHLHATIGSTNDRAAELAREGAPEGALVLADEQTAGRGRLGRKWRMPRGSGIAMSLIMRPSQMERSALGAIGLVGALATIDALEGLKLEPRLKWPNDVLLGGKKVAGVLAEASWTGSTLDYVVLGIGVNVRPVPLGGGAALDYASTSVEDSVGETVDRGSLVFSIVAGVDDWYQRLEAGEAHPAWEERLAFKSEWVSISNEEREITGRPIGLTPSGGLRIETADGEKLTLEAGSFQLRPINTDPTQPN
ncbi:MAG: biotin--[acetyl-CoA-carboxylase] ligase [Chloroflexi bacterium]|nr:biotin--[acetyl-CoA-carboxylase] ligase [Chloroflexota bacterium]MDK1044716.1 biotin--[acetyl-CoA-carboxylase] ligase [Anaerolineales bacterium]MCH8094076.1 biotin--[acetyl-CoA-carboxylase] ligase [Chloroflexota bacterium]MCH8340876.1 biotin--[acetyl-CoA-carboxylase] ligase [Chloroflexota bacterium]MCH8877129.1 biotin--[acetyl-CoA-carboxylase] ligase [Chloroflexota bacterium]